MLSSSKGVDETHPEDNPSVRLPDIILPAQFHPRSHSKASGECRLMIALLEDAIHCFQKHLFAEEERNRRLFREADEWIRSERPDAILSFEYVCGVLGLEPGYLRRQLQLWQDQQMTRAAAAHPRRSHGPPVPHKRLGVSPNKATRSRRQDH
jgi:hypothetical protein